MKILFSPSEAKIAVDGNLAFSLDNFIFQELKDGREFVLNLYRNFITNASFNELSKLFGTKNKENIEYYKTSFESKFGIKAVLRYNGVAYKALNYHLLDKKAQSYIDKNTFIFSNLYGVIQADTPLVDYKLKQGEKFSDINIENLYKERFSDKLDEFLKDDDILDLRAGFYQKFYEVKKEHLTLKFIKNGKVVSHFAKHYRGEILRQMAVSDVKNFAEFQNISFQNLKINEIKNIQNRKEIVFSIL